MIPHGRESSYLLHSIVIPRGGIIGPEGSNAASDPESAKGARTKGEEGREEEEEQTCKLPTAFFLLPPSLPSSMTASDASFFLGNEEGGIFPGGQFGSDDSKSPCISHTPHRSDLKETCMHFPAEGRSGRGRKEETNIQNKTTADWMGMWRVGNWLVTVVGNQLGDPRVRASGMGRRETAVLPMQTKKWRRRVTNSSSAPRDLVFRDSRAS